MKHDPAFAPSVVIYVTSPAAQGATAVADKGAGSGPDSGPWDRVKRDHLAHRARLGARLDPDRARRDFPSLWRDYCQTNFRDHRDLAHAFGVSERAARKWLGGETGCTGAHLATAYVRDPELVADLMRIAAE